MYDHTCDSLQFASGLILIRSNFSSHSTIPIPARCFVWSRRMPLIHARFPASARELERCRPVYRTFPGWRTPTTAARRWSELPAAARSYLEWIETELEVPISSVSVGAARDAEVPRR